MLDDVQITLLKEVFANSLKSKTGDNIQRFRARHHQHLDVLDWLQQHGYIRNDRDRYIVRPAALIALSETHAEADRLLYLCEHLYITLSDWYREHAGEELPLTDLAKLADMPIGRVRKAVRYLDHATVFDGTSGSAEDPIQLITPSERLLRHESFADMIAAQEREAEQQRNMHLEPRNLDYPSPKRAPGASEFVDSERLAELRQLDHESFDLRKLIRLCEELNDCWAQSNLFAIGGLSRMLLDHVPPIFGYTTFREVANNFPGRSARDSLRRLEDSSRKISDSLLHEPIGQRIALPTRTRMNFSHDLDVLLGEICRILSAKR